MFRLLTKRVQGFDALLGVVEHSHILLVRELQANLLKLGPGGLQEAGFTDDIQNPNNLRQSRGVLESISAASKQGS